ncbi:MAG TPA: hypothetical protein VH143_08650, partial [Kofleriaceae bacterium]|nr:hypothetical protein [Kofleriaceae bacterium]
MQRMLVAVGVLLVAGSGCAQRSGETAPPPISAEPHRDRVVKAGAMCAHMRTLHDAKCGMFADIELGGT